MGDNSKTYLRVNNKDIISTFEISDVEISYSLKDIKNYGQRNASYTKTITVLRTKESDAIFQSLHCINIVNGYDIGSKIPAEIIKNGIIIFSGNLQVINSNAIFYNVVVANDDVTLSDIIGDKYFKGNLDSNNDLNITDEICTHTLDPSTVRYYLQNNPSDNGQGIFYPVVDFDNNLSSIFDIENDYPLLPAISIKTLFEKIIKDTGYTFYISKDISALMNKMYIQCNNDSLKENYQYCKYYPGQPGSIPFNHYIKFWKSEIGIPTWSPAYSAPNWYITSGTNASLIGYDYLKNPPNTYFCEGLELPYGKLQIDISLCLYAYKTILDAAGITSASADIKLYKYNTKNGNIIQYDLDSVTTDDASLNYSLQKSITDINNTKSKLYLSVIPKDVEPEGSPLYYLNGTIDLREWQYGWIWATTDSFIKITILDSIYGKNKSIDINDILPTKYKQKDFINDILQMFNCFIQVKNNKIIIQSYNDFYDKGGSVNWSNKINDKSIKLIPLKNEQSKNISLKYTNDKDKYLDDFNSKYGYTFGTRNILNDSEFASGNTDITITTSPIVEKRLSTIYEFIVNDPSLHIDPVDELYIRYAWLYDPDMIMLKLIQFDASLQIYSLSDFKSDLNVYSNTLWRAEHDTNWLSIVPSSGYGDRLVKISARYNKTNNEIVGYIRFYIGNTLYATKKVRNNPVDNLPLYRSRGSYLQ
jgi:hypothetical protein